MPPIASQMLLPETCAVAFKEWAGVCAAVAEGRQAILLRKGGIAEGPSGFEPEHADFWLYPTYVHQAEQGLRGDAPSPAPPPIGTVDLGVFVRVAALDYLDRPEALDALDDLHVWTRETLRQRFQYRRPGLWLLAVRAYRRAEPLRLTESPAYAGCRTWVPLIRPLPTEGLTPSLADPDFAALLDRLGPARPRPVPIPGSKPDR